MQHVSHERGQRRAVWLCEILDINDPGAYSGQKAQIRITVNAAIDQRDSNVGSSETASPCSTGIDSSGSVVQLCMKWMINGDVGHLRVFCQIFNRCRRKSVNS